MTRSGRVIMRKNNSRLTCAWLGLYGCAALLLTISSGHAKAEEANLALVRASRLGDAAAAANAIEAGADVDQRTCRATRR